MSTFQRFKTLQKRSDIKSIYKVIEYIAFFYHIVSSVFKLTMSLITLSDECLAAALKAKSGKVTYCFLKFVNNTTVEVESLSETSCRDGKSVSPREAWAEVEAKFPEDRCVLALVNVRYLSEVDAVERAKLILVHWAPARASMKEKMVASFSLNGIINQLGSSGIAHRHQAGNVADLDYAHVVEQALARSTVK